MSLLSRFLCAAGGASVAALISQAGNATEISEEQIQDYINQAQNNQSVTCIGKVFEGFGFEPAEDAQTVQPLIINIDDDPGEKNGLLGVTFMESKKGGKKEIFLKVGIDFENPKTNEFAYSERSSFGDAICLGTLPGSFNCVAVPHENMTAYWSDEMQMAWNLRMAEELPKEVQRLNNLRHDCLQGVSSGPNQ